MFYSLGQALRWGRAITSRHGIRLEDLYVEAEVLQSPCAEQKNRIRERLTVGFVHASIDGVVVAVERYIANAETLPIPQQANQVSANLTTRYLVAESLARGLDVQKS